MTLWMGALGSQLQGPEDSYQGHGQENRVEEERTTLMGVSTSILATICESQ